MQSEDRLLVELHRLLRELRTMRQENATASRQARDTSWIQTLVSIAVGSVLPTGTYYLGLLLGKFVH